jgi:hypothetical protein
MSFIFCACGWGRVLSSFFGQERCVSVFLCSKKNACGHPLTKTALARLEGFHIRAADRMAKKRKPWRGPNHVWVYPATGDMLKECGMHSISH